MAEMTSKYDGMEIPDSEDEPFTSSPRYVPPMLESSPGPTEVAKRPYEITQAPVTMPRDEAFDSDFPIRPEDEPAVNEGISTNLQSTIHRADDKPTALQKPTASEESVQRVSPVDERASSPNTATQPEEQDSPAEAMSINEISTVSSNANAPAALNDDIQETSFEVPMEEQASNPVSDAQNKERWCFSEDASVHNDPFVASAAEVTVSSDIAAKKNSKVLEAFAKPEIPIPAVKRAPQKATPGKSLKSDPATTLAELTAQRDALFRTFAALPSISPLLVQHSASSAPSESQDSELPSSAAVMPIAKDLIDTHIKLLHTYNEIKDIGQGLMGLLADQRGVRIVEVQEEFEVGAKD